VSSQRRLERKLKELNITLDEERQQHTEQRDQVNHTHFKCTQSSVSSSTPCDLCIWLGDLWNVSVFNACVVL